MPAPATVVFALLHDYERRLSWDTLLSACWLENGATVAGKGVVSVCVGRWSLGGLALKTEYVSFEPGKVAAVKMLNQPPFFGTWAASIRHESLDDHRSRVTYTYNFTARPRWLAWALEPVMALVFRWETRRRLAALRAYLATR
jgi:Polyketide cyclase / dehydrase and lipid transport